MDTYSLTRTYTRTRNRIRMRLLVQCYGIVYSIVLVQEGLQQMFDSIGPLHQVTNHLEKYLY